MTLTRVHSELYLTGVCYESTSSASKLISLVDIVIDWSNGERDANVPFNLTEMCLFGLTDHDDGKYISLRESKPGRWEAHGAFEL